MKLIPTYSLAITSLISVYLAGCATDPATLATYERMQAKPTIKISCAQGCEAEYTDPRDRASKMPTTGWDVANNIVSTTGSVLAGAVVPAAMGIVAIKGFDALKGSGQVTTTTTTTNTDDHSATATPTVVQAPSPVIVQQPAPVQIPAPVVVQIPAGQVINPVIVSPVVVGP